MRVSVRERSNLVFMVDGGGLLENVGEGGKRGGVEGLGCGGSMYGELTCYSRGNCAARAECCYTAEEFRMR